MIDEVIIKFTEHLKGNIIQKKRKCKHMLKSYLKNYTIKILCQQSYKKSDSCWIVYLEDY